ncbi:Eco57I restriction-modification methylase domain-containing protein [Conservatibacter flavescens]|uniref:site-specific DNA-methyltransferase (adenine-specific) n=1 Tax=Conservatibacter flavescens TaxID=28161 RepID=A0A2M8S3I6_9PAST|nr:Eco57I restriction-modification methylase domain-containing protein [Conservatibacter flavescens]PJG85714.1 restriction endonuclease [Conservatibacter flavescens]
MKNEFINYNPDVLSCIANLSNDEVFTPPDVANAMLDLLPQELFSSPDTTFLDPACKSGVFLREITKRLLKGLEPIMPDLQQRINHILTKQVFGLAITELTALLTRRSLYCAKYANSEYAICDQFNDEQGNIFYSPLQHSWADGKCTHCGASQAVYDRGDQVESHAYSFIHLSIEEIIKKDMQFDVIIGNPPYQLSDGGAQASAIPIYHLFVEQAKKLNPRFLSMIIPARWYAGGRGLDKFRETMLSENNLVELHDFPNSNDCFTGVEIKGGVCYFLWDYTHKDECLISTHENGNIVSKMKRPLKEGNLDVFIRYNQAINILRKVQKFNEDSFNTIISSLKPFGLRTFFKGRAEPYKEHNVKLYQNKGIGHIKITEILSNHKWIDTHKVLVPRAIGSGNSKTDLVKPIYAEKGTACTETYLVFGPFENKTICENVMSYINTRFFHFMLTLKKNTQDATKKVYELIPMQDFSKPWTDKELYEKYQLTQEEIDYIESMVRPME